MLILVAYLVEFREEVGATATRRQMVGGKNVISDTSYICKEYEEGCDYSALSWFNIILRRFLKP